MFVTTAFPNTEGGIMASEDRCLMGNGGGGGAGLYNCALPLLISSIFSINIFKVV